MPTALPAVVQGGGPPCQGGAILLDCRFLAHDLIRKPVPTFRDHAWACHRPEAPMVPFFVQIKCNLGKSYEVANKLADAEIASEIYSTAGEYDLLVKFYVEAGTDIGHFVNERVQTIPGIQDTLTIITFKAFS
jgi:DNA-binding Lrp family transcriptional regulator